MLVRNTNLHEIEMDSNFWKWAPNREYTAASTYKIQFEGSYSLIQQGKLWKVKAEPKVKFFTSNASKYTHIIQPSYKGNATQSNMPSVLNPIENHATPSVRL
jgi:hypothetical protein